MVCPLLCPARASTCLKLADGTPASQPPKKEEKSKQTKEDPNELIVAGLETERQNLARRPLPAQGLARRSARRTASLLAVNCTEQAAKNTCDERCRANAAPSFPHFGLQRRAPKNGGHIIIFHQ